ncbi:MAG: VWA domain-containing protein, partial [Acidobacteria bacterium]|nr:VWA domain-containing protein [Acidobacteriota bacterium]
MKTQSSLSLILMLSTFAPSTGQSPTPSPAPSPVVQQQPQDKSGEEDEVVRITSNLVQVDAVVTDSKGKLVTDLTAEDFEILEDNRPQKITNLSFVSNETSTAGPLPSAAPRGKDAPPLPPPARIRPEQVRRTVALVVDDLGLSFESAYYVRRALKKFVDDQMQPTDLVAIIRTGGGMGALQQFTSDKRQLYAAIERVRWNPQGRAGISSFASIRTGAVDPDEAEGDAGESARDLSEETDQFREELFTVGTLGALNYIIRGLKDLPGRKSVLLLTDGFKISSGQSPLTLSGKDNSSQGTGRNARIVESLRRLTDLANRASVVIYTMDPRGLATLGFSAEDDVSNLSPDQISDA